MDEKLNQLLIQYQDLLNDLQTIESDLSDYYIERFDQLREGISRKDTAKIINEKLGTNYDESYVSHIANPNKKIHWKTRKKFCDCLEKGE